MAEIIIYSSPFCPYCMRAKQLLEEKGLAYTEISIDGNPALRQEMISKSGRQSVPQIFINGQHIGGCDDMYALDQQGQLDKFLQE